MSMMIVSDKKFITTAKSAMVVASLFLVGCMNGHHNEDKAQSLRDISKVTKLFIPDSSDLIGYNNLFDNDESVHARIRVKSEDYRSFESSLPQPLVATHNSPDKILYDDEGPEGSGWWVPSELLNPRGRIMRIDSLRTLTVLVGDIDGQSSHDVYIHFVGP